MTRESLAIPLPIKMMWMKHPLDPHAEHTTNDEANASQYEQPTEFKIGMASDSHRYYLYRTKCNEEL